MTSSSGRHPWNYSVKSLSTSGITRPFHSRSISATRMAGPAIFLLRTSLLTVVTSRASLPTPTLRERISCTLCWLTWPGNVEMHGISQRPLEVLGRIVGSGKTGELGWLARRENAAFPKVWDSHQTVRTALDRRIWRSEVSKGRPATSAVAPIIRSAGSLG